jgi:hypothetical protein
VHFVVGRGVIIPVLVIIAGLLSSGDANATVASELATLPAGVLSVTSAAPAGSPLVADGLDKDGFAGPDSLFVLAPTASPFALANNQYTPVSAVSSNGRFLAWADECAPGDTQKDRVYLADPSDPDEPTQLTLPAGYTRVGIARIAVTPSGRVTALVSNLSYTLCGPTGSSPDDREAIVTAAPGVRGFRLVADVPTNSGGSSISTDGSTFVLCSADELVSVEADPTFRVRRARVRDSFGPDCAAGDGGTAYQTYVAPGRHLGVITLVGNRATETPLRNLTPYGPHGADFLDDQFAVGTPSPGTNGTGLVSPSGKDALFYRDPTQTGLITITSGLVLFNGATRAQTYIRVPSSLRGWGLTAAGWLTPTTVVAFPGPPRGGKDFIFVIFLNLKTRKWGPLLRFRPPGYSDKSVYDASYGTYYCALPSGRILFAGGRFGIGAALKSASIFVSNAGGTKLAAIDTSELGVINRISCPAGADHVFASVGQDPASLYSIPESSLDGSAWIPAALEAVDRAKPVGRGSG